MSVVEQKKERIRAALRELDHPISHMSACEAMRLLHLTVGRGFHDDDDGSIGDFVGDDDFKDEILQPESSKLSWMRHKIRWRILHSFIGLPATSFAFFAGTTPSSPPLSWRTAELNSFWSV
jgi:hypothetical protein